MQCTKVNISILIICKHRISECEEGRGESETKPKGDIYLDSTLTTPLSQLALEYLLLPLWARILFVTVCYVSTVSAVRGPLSRVPHTENISNINIE